MGNVKKNKWFIAVKKRGQDLFDLSDLVLINPPEDTYMADPFLFKQAGKHYLFFEWYDYEKGRIAYSELLWHNGRLLTTDPKIILDPPYHCSFPAIFEDEGEVYMTPETGQAGRVELWKAQEFPDKWVKVKDLVGGNFGDPIIFKNGKKYWLFVTEGDNDVRIFEADSLFGEWRLMRSETELHSRSAGHVFRHGGKTIRPVQDCVGQYGRAIHFKDMDTGAIIRSIKPDWHPNLTGTHTFNFNDNFVVIDGRIKL